MIIVTKTKAQFAKSVYEYPIQSLSQNCSSLGAFYSTSKISHLLLNWHVSIFWVFFYQSLLGSLGPNIDAFMKRSKKETRHIRHVHILLLSLKICHLIQ